VLFRPGQNLVAPSATVYLWAASRNNRGLEIVVAPLQRLLGRLFCLTFWLLLDF
jgi:hypothetical protein